MIIGIDASKAAETKRTGVENFAYEVIRNLKLIDRKNTYFLYTNKHLPIELTSENFIEKYLPIPKLWNKIGLPLALIKDRPDKYFQPVYMIPNFAPKSIGVFHDLAWHYFPDAYSKKELFSQKKALKNLKDRAKKIICVSNSAKNDLLGIYPDLRDKTIIIYPSGNDHFKKEVDFNDFLDLKAPFFLSVGRLEERKNTLTLIKAFIAAKQQAKLPHKLVLVGTQGYGYSKIAHFLDQHPESSSDIIITGYINGEELNHLMSATDAYVSPTLYEGFGIAVQDAMKAGAPVIVSNCSALPESVGGAGIMIDPNDIAGISAAMIELAQKPELRREKSEESLQVSSSFTWEKTAKQILTALEEL